MGAGVLAGAAVVSVMEAPLSRQIQTAAAQTSSASTSSSITNTTTSNNTVSSSTLTASSTSSTGTSTPQIDLDTMTGFLTLSVTEQTLLEAIAETLIPSDSNGPGAKEAGVVYFIDRQLGSEYGKSAYMYTKGPFVMPNQPQSITVEGFTYSGGSAPSVLSSTTRFQYGTTLREFFRYGLEAFEAYCNAAYGGNFESLSAANQVAALQDLYNNKPASFNDIIPQDFFYDLFFIVWAGYLTDPLYGGNRGMVGWDYVAFNGVNQGNFYGEGYTTKELMVATTPTKLQPASLAQFQKGSP